MMTSVQEHISTNHERKFFWTTVASICLTAVIGGGYIYLHHERVFMVLVPPPYTYRGYQPNQPLTLGNLYKKLYILRRKQHSANSNSSKMCDLWKSNAGDTKNRANKEWVKVLLDLPNFSFGLLNVEDFYTTSSLLEFYHKALRYSLYPTVHQADILRLFVLYIYGGTYMDLDVISLRSLDSLGVNFMGFERADSVNNAVMNFEPQHQFLKEGLFEAIRSYVPYVWAKVGPDMLTELIRKCSNISDHLDGNSLLYFASCKVTVLPIKDLYAVRGDDWPYFYNSDRWPKVRDMLNESYTTHYWNHLGSFPLLIGSNQPLVKLAEQHCAGVYNVAGQTIS